MDGGVDLSDFIDVEPAENILAKIDAAVELLRELNRQADEAAERAKQLKDDAKRQATEVLPELMEEARQEELTTGHGIRIKYKKDTVGNCPKASSKDPELLKRRARIFKWLDDHGYGKLVKRQLQVQFDREQGEDAKKLLGELRERGMLVRPQLDVAPPTLNAFIRSSLKKGVDIPEDLFSLHEVKEVKIISK